MGATLRWLTEDDVGAVVDASHLFDEPATDELSRRFLAAPNHHLCVAYVGEDAAGFVSGVVMHHPDKGSEMFLYELGVDDAFQRRGIGRALVAALVERAKAVGCYGMWVLTDADNEAALATYRSAGGDQPSEQVMLEWSL